MLGQMNFDDYDAGFKSTEVERRLAALFPSSELLGYSWFYTWSYTVDYWVVVRLETNRSTYYFLHNVSLHTDGKADRGYINSTDFTPHSFQNNGPKMWIWKSVEDREAVFMVALKNHRKQLKGYNSSYDQIRKQKINFLVDEYEFKKEEKQEDANQLTFCF